MPQRTWSPKAHSSQMAAVANAECQTPKLLAESGAQAKLGNWLRNWSKKHQTVKKKDTAVAAAVEMDIAHMPRSPCAAVEKLFLCKAPIINKDEVCIIFSCKGMLDTMCRYDSGQVCLAVDGKKKVASRNYDVATVSLLVKDKLRPTHLTNMHRGVRTQARAWTSHAVPLLQAIFHSESAQNYKRLFHCLCKLWRDAGLMASFCRNCKFSFTKTFTLPLRKLDARCSRSHEDVMISFISVRKSIPRFLQSVATCISTKGGTSKQMRFTLRI